MKILVSTFGGDGGKSGISQYIMHLMKAFPKVAPDIQWDVLAFEGEEELYLTDPDRVLLSASTSYSSCSLIQVLFSIEGKANIPGDGERTLPIHGPGDSDLGKDCLRSPMGTGAG